MYSMVDSLPNNLSKGYVEFYVTVESKDNYYWWVRVTQIGSPLDCEKIRHRNAQTAYKDLPLLFACAPGTNRFRLESGTEPGKARREIDVEVLNGMVTPVRVVITVTGGRAYEPQKICFMMNALTEEPGPREEVVKRIFLEIRNR
jgi:hypothetical protein